MHGSHRDVATARRVGVGSPRAGRSSSPGSRWMGLNLVRCCTGPKEIPNFELGTDPGRGSGAPRAAGAGCVYAVPSGRASRALGGPGARCGVH